MKITTAIRILTDAHTRDDDHPVIKYTVQMMPDVDYKPYSRSEYTEAWGVLRDFIRSDRIDLFTALDRIDFKPCDNCGQDIRVGSSDCPHCGHSFWRDEDGQPITS